MTDQRYWMRWLRFIKLRDLLSIVSAADCKLRAKDLYNVGISRGVLIHDNGSPFKPTPAYHYRRTLERLGFVNKKQGRYCLHWQPGRMRKALVQTDINDALTDEQREIFSTAVVANNDCADLFFSHFLTRSDLRVDTVREFVASAQPIAVAQVGSYGSDAHLVFRNLTRERRFNRMVVRVLSTQFC